MEAKGVMEAKSVVEAGSLNHWSIMFFRISNSNSSYTSSYKPLKDYEKGEVSSLTW